MGITIAYRGRLSDLSRVEDFEDRLLDLALEVGGMAQIWRSSDDTNPERMVRGVILNLTPGQEPVSLLLSPEGWLVGLTDIEDAERGQLKEPPWCFTKTQFGPLEGHVVLAEMLAELRREFLPNLEVSDEGGYYETHDLAELRRRFSAVGGAIQGLTEGLRRHGLSHEAAEDPEILLRHIERVAELVHRVLRRPAEHPPVDFPEEGAGPEDPQKTEALWDEMFKHNRRQQERLQRALEERRSNGEDDDAAFEGALDDLALELPDEEAEEEPWDEEVPESLDDEEEETEFKVEKRERHPLLQRATDLLMRLHDLFRGKDVRLAPLVRTLFEGAGDMVGGLAQALSGRGEEDEDDPDDYGLRVVQLKRALRGLAFSRGALFSLRSAVAKENLDDLHRTFEQLEHDIFEELSKLRSGQRGDEG